MIATILLPNGTTLFFVRNHLVVRFLFVATVLLACACPLRKDGPTGPGMVEVEGLRHVSSKGQTVTLYPHKAALESDTLGLQASFSYDFYIDTCEVTIEKYSNVCGSIPSQYLGIPPTLSEPVCHVTLFDAAFFCNQRSKRDGYDTVYTYLSAVRSLDGNIINMSHLAIRYNVMGYRLPTEAEWVFAASGSKGTLYPWGDRYDSTLADSHAWNLFNSGNAIHSVGMKTPNTFGLYDMGGNAIEWCQDILGDLPSLEVENFAGVPGDWSGEHPLKGGSFRHGPEYNRIDYRRDVYPTFAGSCNNYIGFRCVVGSIPNPSFVSESGVPIQGGPIKLLLTKSSQFFGTRKAKVAFVNKSLDSRILGIVDWTKEDPYPFFFYDFTNVFLPTLSPSGNYVAFCTNGEGISDTSSVIIRSSQNGELAYEKVPDSHAFVPRWWVDPMSLDTFIVYVTSTVDNNSLDWSRSQTKCVKVQAGRCIGQPEVLIEDGGYHGGRSLDGSCFATGYTLLKTYSPDSGHVSGLFSGPENGKFQGDISQVCNVSISPDSGQNSSLMFLDFGSYGTKSDLVGRSYGAHEYIFVSDFSGRAISWYGTPQGYESWNHCEWSNVQRFAISAATGPRGKNLSIWGLDLADSQYVEILEGENLWHPSLWIGDVLAAEQLGGYALDSLGRYDEPLLCPNQRIFQLRMNSFWHRHDELEIVFLGNSRAGSGFDPRQVKDYQSINLSDGGGGFGTTEAVSRNYLFNHCPKLRLIVTSAYVDSWGMFDMGFLWDKCHENSKGIAYDRQNNFWKAGIPQGMAEFLSPSRWVEHDRYDSLGLWQLYSVGWGGGDPEVFPADFALKKFQQQLGFLCGFLDECEALGVELLFVIMPQSPHYKDTKYFGRHGITWRDAGIVIEAFDSLASVYPSFHLYDAYQNGNHDYIEEDAVDYDHLSELGAIKLTARLDSVISVILGE